MRHRLTVLIVTLTAVLAAGVQTASADTVTGTLTFTSPTLGGPVQETYEASSGPNGESPSGQVQVSLLDSSVVLDADVTCLAVTGNRAVIGMSRPDPIIGDISIYRLIVDGGAGAADAIGTLGATGPPRDCATVALEPDPALRPSQGDALVTDTAAFPTRRSQCEDGGWQTYGYVRFEECIRAVRRHARLACIFEREAHGVEAFRAKYGMAYHGLDAMERCRKSWIRGDQPA